MLGINQPHKIDGRRKCFEKEHPDSCFYSGGFKHCDCYQAGEACHCCGAIPEANVYDEHSNEVIMTERDLYE